MINTQNDASCFKHILIIEDDESIREVMQIALQFEGYTVSTAANGKEGIELLPRIRRPCLIFLDLMMPLMDGWGFAEALEATPSHSDIPIIVVTAFSDQSRPIRAKEIIKKPVEVEYLFKIAKQYCGSRQE